MLKTIALWVDVRDLTLDAHNISVLLHEGMDSESIEADVQVGAPDAPRRRSNPARHRWLSASVDRDKTWITARNAITAKVAESNRVRKQLLERALTRLSVTQGRTFTIALTVGDENLTKGDIPLHSLEHDDDDLSDLKAE